MERRILAVVNDLQCGNELAICNPSTRVWRWDGKRRSRQQVSLNPAQEYLWEVFMWSKNGLFEFAEKDRIDVIVNGDMTDGNFFEGHTTNSPNNQVIMAVDVLDEIVRRKQVASVRLTSSTGVHAFAENSADTQIVDKLNEKYPDKDIALVEHGLLRVGSAVIDYAHHGPEGGIRQWLKGNQLYLYVKDIVHQSHDDGQPVPNIVLRAHKHERIQVCYSAWFEDEHTTTWGYTVPSWQLLTPYARKATNSTPKVTNGLLAIEIIDGEVARTKWFAKTKYIRTEEAL